MISDDDVSPAWWSEDLADAAWLVALGVLGERRKPAAPTIEQPVARPPEKEKRSQSETAPPPEPEKPRPAEKPRDDPRPTTSGEPGRPDARQAEIHADVAGSAVGEGGTMPDSVGALPLAAPAANALPGARRLARALRPLRRRVPARTRWELDEDATATLIAETGLWLPCLRPSPARWLELALVVEGGHAAQFWSETLREWRRLLECLGAFRDVRVWQLEAGANGKPVLRSPGGGTRRGPNALHDAAGRRIVMLVTEATGASWRDGTLPAVLATWAGAAPTVILQLLPSRLWRASGLGHGWLHWVGSGQPAASSVRLPLVEPRFAPDRMIDAPSVPIITLEESSLALWAAAIVGRSGVHLPAVRFAAKPDGSRPAVARAPGPAGVARATLTAGERVARFLANASEPARQLAVLLAAVPLRLAVMRLVQRVHLPDSDQVHLAEVCLGGLLRRGPADGDGDPGYAFHEGVRAELLQHGEIAPTWQVLETLSAYVSQRLGTEFSFRAFLADAGAMDGPRLTGRENIFAQVGVEVLQALGPRYADAARRLKNFADGSPPSLPVPTPEPPPGDADPLSGVRILWADDYPENNRRLINLLHRAGAHVTTVKTTQEAVNAISGGDFQAVLSDLGRGRDTYAGLRLLDELIERGINLPYAIFASARAANYAQRALRNGACACDADWPTVRRALSAEVAARHATPDAEIPRIPREREAEMRRLLLTFGLTNNTVESLLHSGTLSDDEHWPATTMGETFSRLLALAAAAFGPEPIETVDIWRVNGRRAVREMGRDDRRRSPPDLVFEALAEGRRRYVPDRRGTSRTAHSELAIPLGVGVGQADQRRVLFVAASGVYAIPIRTQRWFEVVAGAMFAAREQGPIAPADVDSIFKRIANRPPQEQAMILLRAAQRIVAEPADGDARVADFADGTWNARTIVHVVECFFALSLEDRRRVSQLDQLHGWCIQKSAVESEPQVGLQPSDAALVLASVALALWDRDERATMNWTRAQRWMVVQRQTGPRVFEMNWGGVRMDLDYAERGVAFGGLWPGGGTKSTQPRAWVLVAGLRSPTLPENVQQAAQLTGSALAAADFGLVVGAWPGADAVVADAFRERLRILGRSAQSWVRIVTEPGHSSLPAAGKLIPSSTTGVEITTLAQLADGIVLINGARGNSRLGEMLAAGKPILPIAATGGDAATMWRNVAPSLYQPNATLHEDDWALLESTHRSAALAGWWMGRLLAAKLPDAPLRDPKLDQQRRLLLTQLNQRRESLHALLDQQRESLLVLLGQHPRRLLALLSWRSRAIHAASKRHRS